jgi:alkaline phosphatase
LIRTIRSLTVVAVVATLAQASVAQAQATRVAIFPPNGARFLPGQKFDIRVEGKGGAPYTASLTINGTPVAFTSGPDNAVDAASYGGFNVRGYSLTRPGLYTLTALFNAVPSGTPTTVTSKITIEPLTGPNFGTKNVIIFLGDGMGVSHRTAARIVSKGVENGAPKGRLAMDTMPGVGLVSTHSLNSIVTDSAPGMACYTTGNHFKNNQEGVFPANVANPFYAPRAEYLGHYLHRTKGTVLGIVTTADIEDATPAANAVFTQARGNGTGIVDQYLDEADVSDTRAFGSGLKVLMGGGRRWFVPSTDHYSSRAAGNDYAGLPADLVAGWNLPSGGAIDPNRNLVTDFKNAGFTYAATKSDLDAVMAGQPDRLLGLFAWGNMNVALDKISERRFKAGGVGYTDKVVQDHRAPDQPMLDEMTGAALAVLSKDQGGFVLMVEGAHIDKQSHQMDAERAIGEVIEFDRAIQVGLDFAKNDGHTLVLVTADHECSGFSLIGGLANASQGLSDAASRDSSTTLDPSQTPFHQTLVGTYDAAGFPTYAMRPDGYPATYDVAGKLLVGFGANGDRFENWLTPSKPGRESLTPTNLANELAGLGYATTAPITRTEKANGYFVRGQAVGRDQAVHTAADVPLSAYAKNDQAWMQFVGTYQNTDVFFKIAQQLAK